MHQDAHSTIAKYTTHAAQYDGHMDRLEHADVRARLLERMHCSPGARMLEIGVGTGRNLSRVQDCVRYTGIDLTWAMLRRAQYRKRQNQALVRGDVLALPFADGTFDAGIATYAFSGTHGNERAFEELLRVVRRGGRVGILDFVRTGVYQKLFGYGYAPHDLAALLRALPSEWEIVHDELSASRRRKVQSQRTCVLVRH